MAGRVSTSDAGETCQILLQKLQRGQEDLRRSLNSLHPSKKKSFDQQKSFERELRATRVGYHLRHRGGCGSNPLCCVAHLPVRRARTEQLSPNTPPSHAARKHRRLSSTPKNTYPPHPPPLPHSHITPATPPHSTDISLENALFSQSFRGRRREGVTEGERGEEREGERNKFTKRPAGRKKQKKSSECVRDSQSKESKKMTVASDGVRTPASVGSRRDAGEFGGVETVAASSSAQRSSLSRVVENSGSIRRRYETKRRKQRGLTVSFVTDENSSKQQQSDCGVPGDGMLRKRRSGDLSFADEKERGESLMKSLNSSRFGALEHHRKCVKPCKKAARVGAQRWAGDAPMLGYDWIAGLVEAGSALESKDEEYFVEMKEFRRVNYHECSKPQPLFLPDADSSSHDTLSPPHPSLSTTSTSHAHCTHSYVLNDRLFPVSESATAAGGDCSESAGGDNGDNGECGKRCPVCEGRRERGDGGKTPVRYIRVSVPRSSVQAPYQLRPHRRRSFDPSDSMALNRHCLAGWSSAKPPGLPPQPSIDLKSAITHSSNSTQPPTTHASTRVRTPKLPPRLYTSLQSYPTY